MLNFRRCESSVVEELPTKNDDYVLFLLAREKDRREKKGGEKVQE